MKILLVSSLYLPNPGGVETTIEELSRNYQQLGHTVCVLTKRYPLGLKSYEKINNVPVYRMVSPKSDEEFKEAIEFLRQNQNKLKADVIHLIGVRRHMPLFAVLLSKHWRVPILSTFSGGDVLIPHDQSTVALWEEGKDTVPQSVYQSDSFTTFSASTRQYALDCLPRIANIDILYGGLNVKEIINAPKYLPPGKRQYIIAIRRLFYSKGIDLLVNAFANLAPQFPDLDLYIIGDGPEMNNLQQLVKEKGITSRVHFLGSLPHKKTLPYLRGAIAAVCPSRSEGGGLINFEAQAAGCVSLGSNIGGIPEYISDQQTGLLFESGNIKDLENKLAMVLNNKKLQKKLVKQASKNIIKYDWSTIANKHIRYYQQIIKDYHYRPFVSWSELTEKLWDQLVIKR